ncbi:XisH family protein [Lusitaniella coriacea LEGE 07157]|uniref:XisH family protein n=1 Tax=Lusitaniella coriacea LEGE 07157 TaxID=945747 RepID=A0A8J7DZK5_9CYAN|nr:XisH family protein [Lusitaniella coriacea]MBE9118536.1 XisH family protein [Lusitaniella coriacea LEGE 07157]
MPAKDIYHDTAKNALIKDGWVITNDPLTLQWGKKDLFVDLGAEKLLAAEKQGQKIAVEIKSFVGLSEVANLEKALGQYTLYYDILQRLEPERKLYLAIRKETFSDIFEEPIGSILLENKRLRLIVFDSIEEVILQWIP